MSISKSFTYAFLLGMSSISALLIFLIQIIIVRPHGGDGLDLIIPFIIAKGLQNLLVVPATIFVKFCYTQIPHQDKLYKISSAIMVGIPFAFNALGANSYFITIPIAHLQANISHYFFYRNMIVAVKEEEIVENPTHRVYLAYYHAVLHIENNTGKIITSGSKGEEMMFWIGAYDVEDSVWDHKLGVDWMDATIPTGESYLEIYIPIDHIQCGDDNLAKPLSIRYSVPTRGISNSIPLSNDINKQLQQVACNSIQ